MLVNNFYNYGSNQKLMPQNTNKSMNQVLFGHKYRITGKENITSAMWNLGHTDAFDICAKLTEAAPQIYCNRSSAKLDVLVSLDILGIYDKNIVELYKNVCEEDAVKTIEVLIAARRGIIKKESLFNAICNEEKIDINNVIARLKKECPPNKYYLP